MGTRHAVPQPDDDEHTANKFKEIHELKQRLAQLKLDPNVEPEEVALTEGLLKTLQDGLDMQPVEDTKKSSKMHLVKDVKDTINFAADTEELPADYSPVGEVLEAAR